MTCKLCGFKMESFRDDLSKREAALSGLCQACQDSYFGGATETQMTAKTAEKMCCDGHSTAEEHRARTGGKCCTDTPS